MKKTVYCYDIKYAGKEAIISISGQSALESFAKNGYVNFYSGDTAPTALKVEVDISENWLDEITATELHIKEILKEETGLSIKSFNWRVLD